MWWIGAACHVDCFRSVIHQILRVDISDCSDELYSLAQSRSHGTTDTVISRYDGCLFCLLWARCNIRRSFPFYVHINTNCLPERCDGSNLRRVRQSYQSQGTFRPRQKNNFNFGVLLSVKYNYVNSNNAIAVVVVYHIFHEVDSARRKECYFLVRPQICHYCVFRLYFWFRRFLIA